MIQTPDAKGPELDASELTREEWFFLWAAFGQKPDASLKEASEWHKRSFGMTQLEKRVLLKAGLESLLARGFIQVETDKDGKPKMLNGQPVYIGVGKIVSRVKSIDPKKLPH